MHSKRRSPMRRSSREHQRTKGEKCAEDSLLSPPLPPVSQALGNLFFPSHRQKLGDLRHTTHEQVRWTVKIYFIHTL